MVNYHPPVRRSMSSDDPSIHSSDVLTQSVHASIFWFHEGRRSAAHTPPVRITIYNHGTSTSWFCSRPTVSIEISPLRSHDSSYLDTDGMKHKRVVCFYSSPLSYGDLNWWLIYVSDVSLFWWGNCELWMTQV